MSYCKSKKNFFDFKFSWVLVPLLLILYYFLPSYRQYLNYYMFSIGLLGIIMSIRVNCFVFLNIITHLPLFIGLIYQEKYFIYNKILFIMYLFGVFITLNIPFWPYSENRNIWVMIFTYISLFYLIISLY